MEAFLVSTGVAMLVSGVAIANLPLRWVRATAAALFIVMGVIVLLGHGLAFGPAPLGK